MIRNVANRLLPPRRLLAPLGHLYLAGAAWRNLAFDRGWFSTQGASCPVLSVGNLSAGGTGKTPTVIWLLDALKKRGMRAAMVSRGYRGRRSVDPLLVWNDGKLLANAESAGDEAVMIAESARPALVAVGKRRAAAAHLAARHGAEVIVLDDGFQHRNLSRDLDILLLDARSPFEGGRGLPAGTLRETPNGIARAQILVLTRADEDLMSGSGTLGAEEMPEELARLWLRLPSDSRPAVFAARHEPSCLSDPDGNEVALDTLSGRQVVATSGIARPHAFESTLEELQMKVAKSLRWPDHHTFRKKDTDVIRQAVSAHPEAAVVTTSKDAVRWPREAPRPWVLSIALALRAEAQALAIIDEAIRASSSEMSCRNR